MPQPVHAGRSRTSVGVTGAAGPLGVALARRLVQPDEVSTVVGLDISRRPIPGVTWRLADVRDPTLASRLTGIDTLVHLATDRSHHAPAEERRAINVRGTENVLAAAARAGVRRVVLLTSAMVYGASAANAVPLDEDAPVSAPESDGLVGDWLAMERAATQYADALDISAVRPASLVGVVADALLPGLFEAVRLLAIRDGRCHWQFCHTDDLTSALALAARGEVGGPVTVGCDGWLEQAQVEQICGRRSVVVPKALATTTASRLHRVGMLSSPASDLEYLVHPWVVGSQRLRAAGWSPEWSNEDVLQEHLCALGERAGRGLLVVDRKDATRAAAGATVAIIGSLAVARARGRRP